MELKDFFILSLVSLFVIVDPVTIVPSFLAMTENNTPEERVRTAKVAAWATGCILMTFFIGGQLILRIFGITVPAFKIAGGLVLIKVSMDMLQARRTAIKETPEEEAEGTTKDDIAVTPLACPMLAGPGAITTVILLAQQAVTWLHKAVLLGDIIFISFVTFWVFRAVAGRPRGISAISLRIAARLMGLLLTAIAVQFIINGVSDLRV
ncbi:MAG: NAAT family transporter [Candidatus Omnitrophica bacterium]|nr:NAAT family transporter [Candidatus Omnitrophota bacterium]